MGRGEDQEISAQVRMARAALSQIDAVAAETGSSLEAVERVSAFYADRIDDWSGAARRIRRVRRSRATLSSTRRRTTCSTA